MSVDVHLGKNPKKSYIFKDFNLLQWPAFKAWLVMRKNPKWVYPPAGSQTSNTKSQSVVED